MNNDSNSNPKSPMIHPASHYIFLRGLKQVCHTVFAVASNKDLGIYGQKSYKDPITKTKVPFSSGQQVKRSIMDQLCELLNRGRSPIEFSYQLKKNGEIEQKNNFPLADPTYPDIMLGGHMRIVEDESKASKKKKDAKAASIVYKRRSPLSISALRPLHPSMANMNSEVSITVDRRGDPNSTLVLLDPDGKPLTEEQMQEHLDLAQKNLAKMHYIEADKQPRAYGLFVYDIAIDLRNLFFIATAGDEPVVEPKMLTKLEESGWIKVLSNALGSGLVAPLEYRVQIIESLADAVLSWRIRSNQARTYDPQGLMAIALSERANTITNAIYPKMTTNSEGRISYQPILSNKAGASLYIAPAAEAIVSDIEGDPEALDNARQWLIDRMMAYPYEG